MSAEAIDTIKDFYATNHVPRMVTLPFNSEVGTGYLFVDSTRRQWELAIIHRETRTGEASALSARLSCSSISDAIEFAKSAVTGSALVQPQDLGLTEAVKLFGLDGGEPELARRAVRRLQERLRSTGNAKAAAALPVEAIRDAEAKRLALRVQEEFGISSEITRLLRSVAGSWLGVKFYSEAGDNGLSKRQAAEAYPMFADFFVQNGLFTRNVILKRLPLAEKLAKQIGVSERTLKKFQGKDWPLSGYDVKEIARFSEHLPPDWFPKSEKDWKHFCIIATTFGRTVLPRYVAALPNQDAAKKSPLGEKAAAALFKGFKGSWEEYHRRCALAYTEGRPPEGTSGLYARTYKKHINWKALQQAASSLELGQGADLSIEFRRLVRDEVLRVRAVAEEAYKEAVALAEQAVLELRAAQAPEDEVEATFARMHPGAPDQVAPETVMRWLTTMHVPDLSAEFLRHACADFEELLDFTSANIVLPTAQYYADAYGSAGVMYLGPDQFSAADISATKLLFAPSAEAAKNAPSLIEAVRHFHAAEAQIIGGLAPEGASELRLVEAGGWAPCTDEYVTSSGVYCVPLVTEQELIDEGTALKHCVGRMGYARKCREQGHHIVSVRMISPTGEIIRLGTAEFGPIDPSIPGLNERQFRAYDNHTPTPAARAALDEYMQAVATGAISVNYEGVMAFRQKYRADRHGDAAKRALYDISEIENLNAAYAAMAPYVHSAVRKEVSQTDALCRHPVLTDIIEATQGVAMEPTFTRR